VLKEDQGWVVAHYVEPIAAWRVTLTPVVLNAAHDVLFLVTGEEKARVLREVIKGPYQPEVFPAQLLQPASGNLHWFIDEPAARDLIPKQKW
jgi:6-phosphogluconolactonase